MKKFHSGGRFAKKHFNRAGPSGFSGGLPKVRARDEAENGRKLYNAVCSVCGVPCQVPFRPNGNRPIYCRGCFHRHGSGGDGYREGEGRPNSAGHHPSAYASRFDDLGRRLEGIERKINMILNRLGEEGRG